MATESILGMFWYLIQHSVIPGPLDSVRKPGLEYDLKGFSVNLDTSPSAKWE